MEMNVSKPRPDNKEAEEKAVPENRSTSIWQKSSDYSSFFFFFTFFFNDLDLSMIWSLKLNSGRRVGTV